MSQTCSMGESSGLIAGHGILFFRKDLGDFFVGVFYLFEMAVPFIAARFILVQLKLKDTLWYVLTSLLMIFAFAVSRVLIFPYLYWTYANHANISILSVPSTIPIKCSLGCSFVLLFQFYWLFLMVRGAFRAFYKMYHRHRQSQ
ncbi:ceramide synthase-like [Gigantopelta aegis]|uniref:ceramide synthase-like n=1 Tax=Gigantopelta aegis TaxID=1735272 RepID=UPI001B889543|nr:ceramide synthase-like [Gigantopelta aegis]